MLRTVLLLVNSFVFPLFVVFNELSQYFDLAIFDFILLNLQLLQFKLILKGQNVWVKLVLERLELVFKILKVLFKRGEHGVQVIHNFVNLSLHFGPQRVCQGCFHVRKDVWDLLLISSYIHALSLDSKDLLWNLAKKLLVVIDLHALIDIVLFENGRYALLDFH